MLISNRIAKKIHSEITSPLNRRAEQKSELNNGNKVANVISGSPWGQSLLDFLQRLETKAFAAKDATNFRSKLNLVGFEARIYSNFGGLSSGNAIAYLAKQGKVFFKNRSKDTAIYW